MSVSRRIFIKQSLMTASATSLAFGGFHTMAKDRVVFSKSGEESYINEIAGFGPLVPDPKGLVDLPAGFSYHSISKFGETMDDGLLVPGKHDGMAAFDLEPRSCSACKKS